MSSDPSLLMPVIVLLSILLSIIFMICAVLVFRMRILSLYHSPIILFGYKHRKRLLCFKV